MSSRENSILIDWLSFTSKIHSPEEIISLLGMDGCGWEVISGMHGYQERLYYESISIHYAGRADMGVWLEMSGQGCRAFETYGNGDYKALFSLTLYVISQPKNQPDGLEGLKSEAIFVPFDIPAGVDLGVQCDFEYEVFQTKSGSAARLVDITPIQKMRFIIEPDVKH